MTGGRAQVEHLTAGQEAQVELQTPSEEGWLSCPAVNYQRTLSSTHFISGLRGLTGSGGRDTVRRDRKESRLS